MLADINKIEVNYRLSQNSIKFVTINGGIQPFFKSRFFVVKFWENEMVRQKEILKVDTLPPTNDNVE
jgi:hypothetical protein